MEAEECIMGGVPPEEAQLMEVLEESKPPTWEDEASPAAPVTVEVKPPERDAAVSCIFDMLALRAAWDSGIQECFLKFYAGHVGRFGHEYLEFEFQPDGLFKYANDSNYKRGIPIKRQCYVSQSTLNVACQLIRSSGILDLKEVKFPEPDEKGCQEVEFGTRDRKVSLTTSKIMSLQEIARSRDVEGLKCFYYLVQDLKCFCFSLINLHFRIKPI